jgi:hypothetical protein
MAMCHFIAWAAWDAVVRVWLVATTWLALRRAPRSLDPLARITDPGRFVRAAIIPAAGPLALALALLPRRRRHEATITLLACKVLDAFHRSPDADGDDRDDRDDRSDRNDRDDRGAAGTAVAAAVGYLTGESAQLPRLAAQRSDRLDALLATRLPILRAALEALPGDAVRRCRTMIEQVGTCLVGAPAGRHRGAAHVLGVGVVYLARLAAPSVRPPIATCRAAGRALQLAGELRDAETPEVRSWLASRALPALLDVACMARWLPARVGAGTRAAVALVVVMSCAGTLRQVGAAVPRRLHRQLHAALAAARSRNAYLATTAALDSAICDALAARPPWRDAPVIALTRPTIVPARPAVAQDSVAAAPRLAALAIELVPRRGADAGDLKAQIGS